MSEKTEITKSLTDKWPKNYNKLWWAKWLSDTTIKKPRDGNMATLMKIKRRLVFFSFYSFKTWPTASYHTLKHPKLNVNTMKGSIPGKSCFHIQRYMIWVISHLAQNWGSHVSKLYKYYIFAIYQPININTFPAHLTVCFLWYICLCKNIETQQSH